MAQPFSWPGKYFYYPIGNASAVCLTRDLSFEEPARILCSGCGDARNVLYTIFNEPNGSRRLLDFTCCDYEPAVLARNVLLFTLLADDSTPPSMVWNIYYHIYLDAKSHSALVEQCQKLIRLSESMESWKSSPYASFLHFATEQTMRELRRHWQLYVDMQNMPQSKLKAKKEEITRIFSRTLKMGGSMSTARSAGPLMMQALDKIMEVTRRFWKTGVTFSSQKLVEQAKLLNPTYVYSRAGDTCCVHYGSDPLIGFHLAPIFGDATGALSADSVLNAVKEEFERWCSAFRSSVAVQSASVPIIRIFWGEATAVSRALQAFSAAHSLNLGIPIAQFTTQVIQLDKVEYETAPIVFNVVDTSNLIDYMGLLNVIICSTPLLDISSPSHVLYTESLLFKSQEGTKEFADRIGCDLTTASHLIGLCPVDYLAGFSSRANTHELMLYELLRAQGTQFHQFHQMTTWKAPATADSMAFTAHAHLNPLAFSPLQLGTFLWDFYQNLFYQEDAMNFNRVHMGNPKDMLKSISTSNLIHTSRETFVLFARIIKERHRLSGSEWDTAMERFNFLRDANTSMPMDRNNTQDILLQLHRYGLYTQPDLVTAPDSVKKVGRFAKWSKVPPLVRICLVVPREKLAVLYEDADQTGTPLLYCDLLGKWSHNIYSSLHMAYGQLISIGTEADPRSRFEADPQGLKGKMPLVVSFIALSACLYALEPPANLTVNFRVRSTMASVMFTKKLGIMLALHSANIMDQESVHIFPEVTIPSRSLGKDASEVLPINATLQLRSQIGPCCIVRVILDDECELVEALVGRVQVASKEVQRSFGQEGASPQITQISPCTMRLAVSNHTQDIAFPFPIQGSKNRLRLARKSLYIEVVVPVWAPYRTEGMKLNISPVIPGNNGILNSWSIHHIDLSALPPLNLSTKKLQTWFDPHIGSMLSQRERLLRKKKSDADPLMLVKDTIHAIMVHAAGTQGHPTPRKRRLFTLANTDSNGASDTIIFVNDIRYDLSTHTVVLDAFVFSGTMKLMEEMLGPISSLLGSKGDVCQIPIRAAEVTAWKRLLPALAERCRTGSWTHSPNCEYLAKGKIPLTEETEADPLCSCGRGKDAAAMKQNKLWAPFAPYVTRIALSPLFGVSYLESIVRDPTKKRCFVCRQPRQPKLLECTACQNVRYCSKECQKKDWPTHKKICQKK